MKKYYFVFAVLLLAGVGYFLIPEQGPQKAKRQKPVSALHQAENNKQRSDYFFNMLRDPSTNAIPENIAQFEAEFSKKLNKAGLTKSAAGYTWKEAGPVDVGGRTRALAIDKTNSNTIIAGGVSGGVWKSTDGGTTWKLKNSSKDMLSVTTICQDPRSGQTNTWYYGSGEWSGNSAGTKGASFYGSGVFKSTDNGETWTQLTVTKPSNPSTWSSYFSYVSRVKVNPVNGDIYVVTNGGWIYRSQDGGNTFATVLGGSNDHYYIDVDIASNGKIIAVLSEYGYNKYYASKTPVLTPGVYVSASGDKGSFTSITPVDFPETHFRSIIRFAPSNPDVAYVLTYTGKTQNSKEVSGFYKLNLASSTSENRSANIPDFSATHKNGYMNTQGSYNMVLEVKPDDENFVVIGATNLFKSHDGFATKPIDVYKNWIGGYKIDASSNGSYDYHHPDQHSFVFDPNNPKKVWSGHDGGLSFNSDVTFIGTSASNKFSWVSKNNGYNVTQFYTFSIPASSTDTRMVGGTQDNGSPYFSFNGNTTTYSADLSSGDGSYCYWGKEDVIVSYQNGKTFRLGLAANGGIPPLIFKTGGWDWAMINPAIDESPVSFINPFVVDPGDEKIVYMLSNQKVKRHNNIKNIPVYNQTDVDDYEEMTGITLTEKKYFSTLAISDFNSTNVLYLGVTNPDGAPEVIRVDNANTSSSAAVTTKLNTTNGAFISNIAVNPQNSNEIIVVLSNYNVLGTFYSNDGGATFTAIEGNLEGVAVTAPGPSIRCASIMPTASGTIYFLGTSVGLFSTKSLSGSSTVWTQEGIDVIGNVVVSALAARTSDRKIVAATHGRGAFVGTYDASVDIVENEPVPVKYSLEQNYPNPFNPSTNITYKLPSNSEVVLSVIDINGREIKTLAKEIQSAGVHKYTWNGTDNKNSKVASGVYFYRLKAGEFTSTRKMLLIK